MSARTVESDEDDDRPRLPERTVLPINTRSRKSARYWPNAAELYHPFSGRVQRLGYLSVSAEQISQALRAQRCPTNKEIRPFFDVRTFNVVAYMAERWSWEELVNESAKEILSAEHDQQKTFYLGKKVSTTLQLDLLTSKIKKGGFKVAVFGTSTTCLFQSGSIDVCAKRTYHIEERLVEKNGILEKKSIEVPHDSRKQFQNLTMEVACNVWAQALLDLVYDFITSEISQTGLPRFHIPKFRFVELAIALEHSALDAGNQKDAVFLVEEVIGEDQQGLFRKYLNNVSLVPLAMKCDEDTLRAKFLAFTQHVQYWKTKKQVFVSDYQGKQYILQRLKAEI
ncbi:hypothetical protein APHAL10511_004051 [Amanita phalloides]|nr:hypothetical protein APHAL10511_004051 [Amanita phalloides]